MDKKNRFKEGYKVLVCSSLGALIVLPIFLLIQYFIGEFIAFFSLCIIIAFFFEPYYDLFYGKGAYRRFFEKYKKKKS